MASFTRDWDESNPTDATYAYEIDEYNRYLRVDTSDRLKAMIYGFTAGENDGVPGFKKLTFKQQASAPATPNADEIVLYALDDGTNCGLYAKSEDGYVKQILKKVGTTLTLLLENKDITGALTFADTITVAGLVATANLDIGAYTLTGTRFISDIATGTAPFGCTSTTKVTNLNADQVDGYDVAAAANQESNTIAGGLVIKRGMSAGGAGAQSVTFGAAFGTACLDVQLTAVHSTAKSVFINRTAMSTTGFSYANSIAIDNVAWFAIGY